MSPFRRRHHKQVESVADPPVIDVPGCLGPLIHSLIPGDSYSPQRRIVSPAITVPRWRGVIMHTIGACGGILTLTVALRVVWKPSLTRSRSSMRPAGKDIASKVAWLPLRRLPSAYQFFPRSEDH